MVLCAQTSEPRGLVRTRPGEVWHLRLGAAPSATIGMKIRRTREELQGISDALLYELQMLYGTAQVLRDEVQGPKQGTLSWPQTMASIEAFAIHARVLERKPDSDLSARKNT